MNADIIHRYYDPNTGRYLTPDPYGQVPLPSAVARVSYWDPDRGRLPSMNLRLSSGTLSSFLAGELNHLFSYVANNPLRYSDPWSGAATGVRCVPGLLSVVLGRV